MPNDIQPPSDPVTPNALIVSFVQGAQWWEYHKTGATMWASDRDQAEGEAETRVAIGTLGKSLGAAIGSVWRVEKDVISAAIPAVESGLDYARECLTTHDSALGRTIHKNKTWAETMEKDIRHMERSLAMLRACGPNDQAQRPGGEGRGAQSKV